MRLTDYYNLERPRTWIQPGTYGPHIHRNEIKAAAEDLGYKSAGTPDVGLKVFNEYDPNNDKHFGMGWGNFDEDDWDLKRCKEVIADRIAKHHVMIGSGHFSDLLDGWTGFLNRIELLIQWCLANNIPIRTYTEWADILYNQIPDPNENIIPPLNIDLDENNIPDGYNKSVEGILTKTDGIPTLNDYSYSIKKAGVMCSITSLGGVEKGKNQFEIWTKGASGNFIEVIFKVGTQNLVYKFPAENSGWTKYNLEQSVNGNTILNTPESISLIDMSISCSNYSTGTVKIGGMKLAKYDPLPVELSSFIVSNSQNTVTLKWQTITEINNYGFEVERAPINPNSDMPAEASANTIFRNPKFEKIGFVQGNGNSNSPKDYSFIDINPSPGTKFIYRLKQIDNDGKFEYSNEVGTELLLDKFILYQNYPNPFNPETKIKFELPERSDVKLIIYDLLGREVMTLEDNRLEPGYYERNWNGINASGIQASNGVYFYRFYGKGESGKEYNKIMKMVMLK